MDFSSYRLSYLKSIICCSIISTTVICIILSCPYFSDSTSTGSTSGSIFVSSSSSNPYSQNQQYSSSSKHHYYLKQHLKPQESSYWNPQTIWTTATSRDTAAYLNGRGGSKIKRRGVYHPHHPSIPIYGSSDAEDDIRAADPDNYDAQRAVFLRHGQRPQRSRVSDLRSRSQRWVVKTLFRSHTPDDRDDAYDDDWDNEEKEGEEEESEYENEDYDFREEQEQDESDSEVGKVQEAKDKESFTLDTILRPASTGSCPWIPQRTWSTRKYNHLQHQQGRCRLRRLYPKHDILVHSQPHQQQDQLSRQPISHRQFPPRLKTRTTWRLESIHPQRPDHQQQHHHRYNKHRQNKHLHTAGGGHSRPYRNGRRSSSSGPLSSACTSLINGIFSLSSVSPFLSTFTDCRKILLDYLSDPPRLAKSSKGAMDTLLYFLTDLPNGLSYLLHQDFASALFSTAPPTTSTRFSHQRQHHASYSSWFSNYTHRGSNNVHGPQRIPPHPLLEMAASNIMIRLGLLVVLCLGAFYYCVTTMEQQQRQIAGAEGGAGSNWLADPVPATSTNATNSNSTTASTTASTTGLGTTATESHPRRSLSDLYPSVTGAFTTTGYNMSLGSAGRAAAGGASTLLTPGMTAAEVMASLGGSVNNLEQLRRQELQQQRVGDQLLNLTLFNGEHPGPESADPTITPSTPPSITANFISALIRTAMTLTCGTANHLHSQVPPYSASTTPALPCSNLFSGSEKVAGGKPGFEPGWKDNAKDGLNHKAQKKKDPQQDVPQLACKEKQKDHDNNNNNNNYDDDDAIYQREQEFGHFSTTERFDTEDDTLREYRNMMYYSSNYPPPYSATFGSGGGESSRSNSRRSSIFTPSPSLPAPASNHVAAAATAVVSHISETQRLVEVNEDEMVKAPFWTHFYTLDALQSTISHRLTSAAMGRSPSFTSHQRQQHGVCSLPSPRQKWTSNKARSRTGMTRRALPNRPPSISFSSPSPSVSIPSPFSSRSVSVSASGNSTASTRRHRARTVRQQSVVQ